MLTTRHLPSLEALVDDDDARMTAELDLLRAGQQVAEARRTLDHVEAMVSGFELRSEDDGDMAASTEVLARLGYRLVAAASELRRRVATDAPAPLGAVTALRGAASSAARRRRRGPRRCSGRSRSRARSLLGSP